MVSGRVIELCQAPRAKPGLPDRNCLFTGYTTVYLKTRRLAGLLHRTPFRYRYQAAHMLHLYFFFNHFLNCILCIKF